ncbi:MAG: carbon-nitrogen hydrolase family protein [Sulfurovum sp.]|nr:carbon-nitrogen hydrolase family protein [Sulfurovaceae bacterium]
MKELTVCCLQLPTLGMNATRLEFYLKNAHKRGVKIILIGEYVLNHFFKELVNIPKSMVKEQSEKHINLLKAFAISYDITFIAPIVKITKDKYYKVIAKISPRNIRYYKQQILIPYSHWNEKTFFSNPIKKLTPPLSFMIDGFKIMVISGFELHFDPFWEYVTKKKVDIVLIPTSSTFGSHKRWRDIIKTKAFLHGCYILRANRLGEYQDEDISWKFYGDSMLVNPEGEVEMMLEDRESMLIETIAKLKIIEHRKSWRFQQELKVRE